MSSEETATTVEVELGIPWRDRIATRMISVVLNRIASRDFRDRMIRTLRTGDPEESVPVEEVVRDA